MTAALFLWAFGALRDRSAFPPGPAPRPSGRCRFILGAAVLFVAFGNRLWLHHAAPLLPILYLGLALSLGTVGHSRIAALVLAVVLVPLLAGNAVDRQAVLFELERTGGVGAASDAVERFTEDVLRDPAPTHVFFPDWGFFMPSHHGKRWPYPTHHGLHT